MSRLVRSVVHLYFGSGTSTARGLCRSSHACNELAQSPARRSYLLVRIERDRDRVQGGRYTESTEARQTKSVEAADAGAFPWPRIVNYVRRRRRREQRLLRYLNKFPAVLICIITKRPPTPIMPGRHPSPGLRSPADAPASEIVSPSGDGNVSVARGSMNPARPPRDSAALAAATYK
ncbi:unnamed protein product, partial [Iphiclides podalirius]